ncbi:MAG: AMP-binding protein [Proteobacteria bacterium]|nr:AMP-binding protein [Pseudomonadota bacterium]
MTLFARKRAAQRPDEIALRDPHRALTWSELDAKLNRVANAALAADLGPERRLAVFAENAVETAIAHLGGLLGGASTVPVNFHLNADEVAYILEDSGTRLLFVGPETVEVGLEAAKRAGVPAVVGWRCGERAGLDDFDDWLAAASEAEPPADHAPRPNLLYTSGTTGRPKGTELPPTMFAAGGTIAEHLDRLAEGAFAQFGTHLVVGPLYHTGPLSGARNLVAGVPSVILERFDAEATLRAIQEHRAESSVMVPTHFVRLLALPEEVRARYDVSSLKLVFHTGAACPVDVKRAMLEWWGPCLYEAYGATEVGTTCSIGPEDWLAHPGSVGQAQPPFEALVVDDDGKRLGPNEEGRLYFRDTTGRGVVYHNDPEKSAAAHLEPGVFTLGEIGMLDADGFVYITDRFSDMVVSGGVNLYPAEAEQALIEHPGVADVACIGVPHPEMGESLHALVVAEDPDAPPAEAELIAFCREHIARYKCPRAVEIVADLGRNTMGKLNKRKLRAPYWENAGR